MQLYGINEQVKCRAKCIERGVGTLFDFTICFDERVQVIYVMRLRLAVHLYSGVECEHLSHVL